MENQNWGRFAGRRKVITKKQGCRVGIVIDVDCGDDMPAVVFEGEPAVNNPERRNGGSIASLKEVDKLTRMTRETPAATNGYKRIQTDTSGYKREHEYESEPSTVRTGG